MLVMELHTVIIHDRVQTFINSLSDTAYLGLIVGQVLLINLNFSIQVFNHLELLFASTIIFPDYAALVQFPPSTAIIRISLNDINKKLFYMFLYMLNSLCSIFSLCMLIQIDVELQTKTS